MNEKMPNALKPTGICTYTHIIVAESNFDRRSFNKFLNQAERQFSRSTNQSGRSMIEMLCVLAVMGLISAAGVWGVEYALNLYEKNQVEQEVITQMSSLQMRTRQGTVDRGARGKYIKRQKVEIVDDNGEEKKQIVLTAEGLSQDVCQMLMAEPSTKGFTAQVSGGGDCSEDSTIEFVSSLMNNREEEVYGEEETPTCGPGYKVLGGRCIACSNSGKCSAYSSGCTCSSCKSGYTLKIGSCISQTVCDPKANCVTGQYDAQCRCTQCESGYYILSSGDCAQCLQKTGCAGETDYDAQCHCTQCDTTKNFTSDGDGGCKCATGYTINTSGNKCCSKKTGCASYDDDCNCTQCDTSNHFRKQGNSCVCDDANHFVSVGSTCQCDEAHNFVASGNSCVCRSGYKLNTAGSCCLDNVDGCSSYDASCHCTSCSVNEVTHNPRYASQGGTMCCELKNHCKNSGYNDSCVCTQCDQGYRPDNSSSGGCTECDIDHCRYYAETGECVCSDFNTDYDLVTTYNKCCYKIHNCRAYNADCTCNDCYDIENDGDTVAYRSVSGNKCCLWQEGQYCGTYNDDCNCATCQSGYTRVLDYGGVPYCCQTVTNCSGYVKNEDSPGCTCTGCTTGVLTAQKHCSTECDSGNCGTYNDDCTCASCTNGQVMSTDHRACCNPETGCTSFNSSCQCTGTLNGYSLSSGGHSCQNKTGCTAYNDNCTCATCDTTNHFTSNGSGGCRCAEGLELDANGNCVSACPPIDGCASYDEDCNCEACEGGSCPNCGSTYNTCSSECLTGCSVVRYSTSNAKNDAECLYSKSFGSGAYCDTTYGSSFYRNAFTCKNGSCTCVYSQMENGGHFVEGNICTFSAGTINGQYEPAGGHIYADCPGARGGGGSMGLGCWGYYCFVEGTLITLANGQCKPIEDIDYDDDLLVWDFDNGCFATSKPLWIKEAEVADNYNVTCFDDGTILKTVKHRIFNKQAGEFTYTTDDDTPIGTVTFTDKGKETTLIQKYTVSQGIRYYNIITERHMNCFANGILTSCRLNNLYAIKDMKFVKDDRKLLTYDDFPAVPRKWVDGLRLLEQPADINRNGADNHGDNSVQDYALRLIASAKPHRG